MLANWTYSNMHISYTGIFFFFRKKKLSNKKIYSTLTIVRLVGLLFVTATSFGVSHRHYSRARKTGPHSTFVNPLCAVSAPTRTPRPSRDAQLNLSLNCFCALLYCIGVWDFWYFFICPFLRIEYVWNCRLIEKNFISFRATHECFNFTWNLNKIVYVSRRNMNLLSLSKYSILKLICLEVEFFIVRA